MVSHKKTAQSFGLSGSKKIQATTYFPLSSIIGPGRLNVRVRNGNGCDPAGKITWKKMIYKDGMLALWQRKNRGTDSMTIKTMGRLGAVS